MEEEGIMIVSGTGDSFPLELPQLSTKCKILNELHSAYCISFAEGKKRGIQLLRNFFPERYRKALEKMSEGDFFKLFFALGQHYRECREKESHGYSDEVIALAFLYKWRLDYAAALPPELRRRCLEHAGVKKNARNTEAKADASSGELAHAIARTLEAIRKYRKKQ